MVRVVQWVRALDCGSRSWGFESPRSPQHSMSARSSVDRVTDFGSVGRGFESCRARHKIKSGLLAQSVEQLTLNQRVVGSSPSQSTIISNPVIARVYEHTRDTYLVQFWYKRVSLCDVCDYRMYLFGAKVFIIS